MILSRSSIGYEPELPETWKHATGTPSSFEKALDDVVRKLDDMGENRKTADTGKRSPRSGRDLKTTSLSQRLQQVTALRRQRIADAAKQKVDKVENLAPINESAPKTTRTRKSRAGSASQKAVKFLNMIEDVGVHEDKDMSDSDILKGLKVICAVFADSDLDAWVRTKAGLQLRRFLADLKTFESLSRDGMAAVDEQRTRRRRAECWRLQAEKDARVERSPRREEHQ